MAHGLHASCCFSMYGAFCVLLSVPNRIGGDDHDDHDDDDHDDDDDDDSDDDDLTFQGYDHDDDLTFQGWGALDAGLGYDHRDVDAG